MKISKELNQSYQKFDKNGLRKRVLNNKLFTRIIALYLLLWCGLQLMQTVSLIYLEQVMLVPIEI